MGFACGGRSGSPCGLFAEGRWRRGDASAHLPGQDHWCAPGNQIVDGCDQAERIPVDRFCASGGAASSICCSDGRRTESDDCGTEDYCDCSFHDTPCSHRSKVRRTVSLVPRLSHSFVRLGLLYSGAGHAVLRGAIDSSVSVSWVCWVSMA